MSVEAISWALNEAPVQSPTAKLVLIGLANHAHPDGTSAFPSVARLMRYTCLSERSVRQQLAHLEALGVITRSDQRIVAAYIQRTDRRPVGWNLSIHMKNGVQEIHPVEERGAGDSGNGVQEVPERGAPDAPETSYNRPNKPPVENSLGESLANQFADSLVETSPTGFRRPVVTPRWIQIMNLMVVEDGRDPEAMVRLMRFAHKHPFWGRHIQSPVSFRNKFDTILREEGFTPKKSAVSAWADVLSKASSLGRDSLPTFDDPATNAIVNEIGWRNICLSDTEHMKRVFMARYRTFGNQVAS